MAANRRSIPLAVLLAILGTTSSCDAFEFDCPGDVRLSVTTGSTTTFDWDPDCAVSGLWVINQNSGEYSWAIEGTFRPPVSYGVLPKGSKTLRTMEPLQADADYRVEVFGAGPYGIHTKGKREFTAV